jgi:DNA-binding HxlR family transcriptional regulator
MHRRSALLERHDVPGLDVAPGAAVDVPCRLVAPDRELIDGADRALDVLSGKWKVHLLCLMARGIRRPSRMLDHLPGGSKKVMTDTLRAMLRDGLVDRRVYAEVPPHVEYRLTRLGWSTTELLISLSAWGASHRDDISLARRAAGFESNAHAKGGSS